MPVRYAVLAAVMGLLTAVLAGGSAAAAPGRAPGGSLAISVDTDRPLLGAGGLTPGAVRTGCAVLTYRNAGAGTTLKLWSVVDDGGLAALLAVRVEQGSGGGGGSCTGFRATRTAYTGTLFSLGRSHGASTSALALGTLPAGSGSLSFRFTFSVSRALSRQGVTAQAGFHWVAESTEGETATAVVPSGGTPAAQSPAPARSLLQRIVDSIVQFARTAAVPAARLSIVALITGALVALFLLVQNRIDRRDPKLASAPVRPPEDLIFRPRGEFR